MTTIEQSVLPLAGVALGDIVSLPDGRAYTARSRVSLPMPVGTMAGFIILGELDVLLSLPPTVRSPVNVYVPVPRLPEYAKGKRALTVYQGATRYWSPHLPAVGGAMGELLYRVLEVRAQLDPIVLVYRGEELIVFVKASYAWPQDLRVESMDRGVDNEIAVARFAAVVGAPEHLAPDVVPESIPAHAGRMGRAA
jgi:hypothetical protein